MRMGRKKNAERIRNNERGGSGIQEIQERRRKREIVRVGKEKARRST